VLSSEVKFLTLQKYLSFSGEVSLLTATELQISLFHKRHYYPTSKTPFVMLYLVYNSFVNESLEIYRGTRVAALSRS